MAATLRELRGRIRSASSIKKITKAQELIATSRIAKGAGPSRCGLGPTPPRSPTCSPNSRVRGALDHPLLVARENPQRPVCW